MEDTTIADLAMPEPKQPADLGDTADTGEAGKAGLATAASTVRYYKVAPGVELNVRSGPGIRYPIVRILPEGISVPIYCQRPGDTITGYYGTSNIWDAITNGQYVSDAYVNTGSDGYVAPRCG
jgi:uncharacterized protein YraI